MSRVDLHPEELIDRELKGTNAPRDHDRLAAHVAQCAACRFEQDVARDLADDAAPRSADAALLAGLVASTTATFHGAERVSEPVEQRIGARRRLGRAAAAAVVLFAAAGGAAAAVATYRPRPAPESEAAPAASISVPSPAEAPSAPTDAPPASASELPPAEASPPAPPQARSSDAAAPRTPAELFHAANQARRRGHDAEAVRLYRELQRRFPKSQEALTSRVSLGKLLLERGDASGAVETLDRYLASQPRGTLSEEALLGRALALMHRGKPAEERAAWQALLAQYPRSVHAPRAQRRLEELR